MVVLLILAGVAISLITGKDGFFSKANYSADKYNEKSQNEANKFNSLMQFVKGNYLSTIEEIEESELDEILELLKANQIDTILADKRKVDKVIANKSKYGNYILKTSDTTNFEKFVANNYAMNKMINNNDWVDEILANNEYITVLDNSNPIDVPTMISNTSPYGQALYTVQSNEGNVAWKAFDNNSSTYWGLGQGETYKNQYVCYDFTMPVWVYKIYVNSYGKQNAYCIIEGSNDKSTWTAITDEFYQGEKTIIAKSTIEKYRYYRLRYTRTTADTTVNGSGNTVIFELQFYGKADTGEIDEIIDSSDKATVLANSSKLIELFKNEYAMNRLIENDEWRNAILADSTAISALDSSNPIKVPTMTSNTSPTTGIIKSIEATSTGNISYKAFDGNSSTYWSLGQGVSYQNQYVGYDFTIPVWVYKIYVYSAGKQNAYYIVEGSNNKSTWTAITDEFFQGERTLMAKSTAEKYRYYRLRYTRTTGDTTVNGSNNTVVFTLQFYGK